MMTGRYDVIIAGGSISGLLAAREVAAKGLSVVVLEDDNEIGTPEHCGGLVSIDGIQNLGIIPSDDSIQNSIKYAKISSASKSFELNAEKQKVVVLDRRVFDKQIAFQTQKMGAEIRVRCSVLTISEKKEHVGEGNLDDKGCYVIKTSDGHLTCKYFVDARGVGSLIRHNRHGVFQSAQYEVYAPWIISDAIEVKFDRDKYPGFFAWIIPISSERGKVGVAGRSINAANVLKSYMDSKGGGYSVVRKVYAPIWIMGPIEHFVSGRNIIIGDAAGQTKPTTAGGIYSCGMGGVLAGRAIAMAEQKNDDNLLHEYEKKWFSIFKSEFEKMLIIRKLLERLDNKAIDELFSTISEGEMRLISKMSDFDFHSTAISRILYSRSGSKIIKTVLGNEVRRLFNG
jgi:digeranylgeranylglycerophospholipid reductase